METKLALFEQSEIRKVWDSKQGDWYFSIVDIIEVLTESGRPRKYWNDLKMRLNDEGSELSANIGQLKMKARDGKKYNTDVGNPQEILRLIQSIPSKKASNQGGNITGNARKELEKKVERVWGRRIIIWRIKVWVE